MMIRPRIVLSFLVLLAALSSACAARTQQKALHTSLLALNSGMAALEAWDDAQQRRIVDEAVSYEDGAKRLEKHRAVKQSIVEKAIIAYSALALAATAVEARDADAAEKVRLALFAVADVYNIVKQLTGGD
jgi:septal ring factor EnvC (AmiA/AmiB activator)